MRPRIVWKCANSENKSIDCIIERPRMVCNGNSYITRACGRDKIAFDARFFYDYLLRDGRVSVALFDRLTWSNCNFVTGRERLRSRSLVLFDFSLAATDICPIARREPTNRQAVD